MIRSGQRQNSMDRVSIRHPRMIHADFETSAQLFQGKRPSKVVQCLAREFVGQSHLNEFPFEERFIVAGIWNLTRFREETCRWQNLDPMVDVDDARSKGNRRNMSLPGSTQAEDKTQSSGKQVRLVRMRHNGGIEKRRRF